MSPPAWPWLAPDHAGRVFMVSIDQEQRLHIVTQERFIGIEGNAVRFNVWKIPLTTTEQELRALFEPYGLVNHVEIVKNDNQYHRHMHGRVDMPNFQEGLAAQKGLVGATLGGHRVSVQRDTTKERGYAALASAKYDQEAKR